MPPFELTRADSRSPALCGPGVWNAVGGKGFVVQPPWMPHFLAQMREKPGTNASSWQSSIPDIWASSRSQEATSFSDLAEELVDIILDMVWRLDTHPMPPSKGASGVEHPVPAHGSSGISGNSSSSPPDGSSPDSRGGQSADGTGSLTRGGNTSSVCGSSSIGADGVAAALQPEVSWRAAKAETAAWASLRLVCRRWDAFFRRKSLALRFEAPMTDDQMQWLAAGPSVVRSLCFAAGEQRAFRVLGSYRFQAASAPGLATLRGVPLSNAADLASRLDDYTVLRHLHAAGGSPALRFAELPPSLRTLEVEGLARCTMRRGTPPGDGTSPASEAAGSTSSGGGRSTDLPPPPNPNLRSISLTSSDTLQLNPDWLAGLQGDVSIACKDLVMPLPPKQIEGESRFMRVETLASLLARSGITSLRLRFQDAVLLDYVASAWPMVVYVLLEGGALWQALERQHEGAFEILKGDGSVVLRRRQPAQH